MFEYDMQLTDRRNVIRGKYRFTPEDDERNSHIINKRGRIEAIGKVILNARYKKIFKKLKDKAEVIKLYRKNNNLWAYMRGKI